MNGGYLPQLGTVLRHGPWVSAGAALAVTPAGFAAVAAVFERRMLGLRREFAALILGDPLLAVSVALGVWLLHGRSPHGLAGLPFGVASMVGSLGFGLLQWRAELRSGFYTRAQAFSPTKIWHQLVVYPVLGYWLWTADLGGLLSSRTPAAGGAWQVIAKATIVGCVLAWLAANVYDRRHPKLGHPPYDWARLGPRRPPWPGQSASIRAYLSDRPGD